MCLKLFNLRLDIRVHVGLYNQCHRSIVLPSSAFAQDLLFQPHVSISSGTCRRLSQRRQFTTFDPSCKSHIIKMIQ